eukprot:m.54442 g.54442  ORF g.54442 m.54442 type:complete len:1808 (-) comp21917_c1_seq1:223-5646(-)
MFPRSRMTSTFISALICLGCVSIGLGQGQDSCAVKGCEGGNSYHFEDLCQCDALCVDFDGADGCCADYDQICAITTTTSVPPTTNTPFITTTCADDPCGTNAASCTDISVDAPSCDTQCAAHVSNCEANTGCASKSDCLLLLQQIGGCTDVACVTGCGGNGIDVTSTALLERAATCFVDDCVLLIPDVTCSCKTGFSGPRCEIEESTSSTTTVVSTTASTIVTTTTVASTTPTPILTTTAIPECTSNPCQNDGVCTDETVDAPSCDVQCADELAACDANSICGSTEVQNCLDSTRVPGGCEDSNCVIACATPFFNGNQATVIQAQLALQSSANCLIDGCKATVRVGVKCECDSDWTGDFCEIEVGATTVSPTTTAPTPSPTITPSSPPTRTRSCAELLQDDTFVDTEAFCKTAADQCGIPQIQIICPVTCSGCTTPPTTSPITSAPTPSTVTPTLPPTSTPSIAPSPSPTPSPSATPTTTAPTPLPKAPSAAPTALPSTHPTPAPTLSPTTPAPSVPPTSAPITAPSAEPSAQPTPMPSPSPTALPTNVPSSQPTATPTSPLATCADDPPPCGKPENCIDITITAPPCSEQCSASRSACVALPLCNNYIPCVSLEFITTYEEALFCGEDLTDATAVAAFEAMVLCDYQQCVSELPNGVECLSDPPTHPPTGIPTGAPSNKPTARPSSHPTHTPTVPPTALPTPSPSSPPTASPLGVTTQPPVPLCNGVEDPPYCAAFDVSECNGIVGCPALCDTCSLSPTSNPVTLSPTLPPTAAPLYQCNGVDDAVACGRFTQSQCTELALGGICPGMCGCTSKPTEAPTTKSPTSTPTKPPVAECNGEPDNQICAQFSKPQCTSQPELQLNKFCPALCGRCTSRPTTAPSTSMPTPAPSVAPVAFCNGLPDPPICFARSIAECVTQGLDQICPALCNTCTSFPSAAPSGSPSISTTLPPSSGQPTTAPSLSTASPTSSKPTATPLGNCGGVLDRSLCSFFVPSDCAPHDLHTSCPAMCGVCPTTMAPSPSITTATPEPSTSDVVTSTSSVPTTTIDIGANETTLTTASPVATTVVTETQTSSSTITFPPSMLSTTLAPSISPTALPTSLPTPSPTVSTTVTTTHAPSASTTLAPSRSPSATNPPSLSPSTSAPTHTPSSTPTHVPTVFPSQTPSASPTTSPSENVSWTLVVNPTPSPTIPNIDAAVGGLNFEQGSSMNIMVAMIIVVVLLFVIFIVLTAVLHHYKHKEKAEHAAERNSIIQPIELDPIVMTGSRPSLAQHGQDATLEMLTMGVTVDAPHLYGSQRNQANPMFHTSQPEIEFTPPPRPLFGGLGGLESLSRWAQDSNTLDAAAGARFTVWGNVDNVDLHKGVKELSKLLRTAAILPAPSNTKDTDVSFIVRYLGNNTLQAEQGLEMVLGSTELFDMCQTLERGAHGDSGKFKLLVRDGELQLRVHGTIRRKRGMDYKASQSNIDTSTFVSCFLYQQAVCLLVRKQDDATSFVLHMYSCKDNGKSTKLQMYLSGMCNDNDSTTNTPSRIETPLAHRSRRFDSPATVNSDSATQGASTPIKYLDVNPTPNTPSSGDDDFALVADMLLSTQRHSDEDPNTHQQSGVSNDLMRAKTPEDDETEVAQMPVADLPGMIPSSSPDKSRHGYDVDDDDGDDHDQYGVVSTFQHDESESPNGGDRFHYKQTHVQSSSVPTTPYVNGGGGGGDDEHDDYHAIVNADHQQHEESYEDGYYNEDQYNDNDEENGYLDYGYGEGSSPEYDTSGKLIEVVELAKVEPSVHVEDVNRQTWHYRRPSIDSSLVSKNDSTTSA